MKISSKYWMSTKNIVSNFIEIPRDLDTSPQYLRDRNGVVHSAVKDPTDDVWHWCSQEALVDWLFEDGKNIVPAGTPVTCLQCLVEEREI